MDAKYFQSWKFAFAMACAMTIAISGYRIVKRHWHSYPTNATYSRYFQDDQPSADLRRHVVAVGVPPASLDFTVGELIAAMQVGGGPLDWQPGAARSIILKSTVPVPLENRTVEVGFQISIADPPQLPASTEFPSGAAIVTAMSVDHELAEPDEVQTYLLALRQGIDAAKGQVHFNP